MGKIFSNWLNTKAWINTKNKEENYKRNIYYHHLHNQKAKLIRNQPLMSTFLKENLRKQQKIEIIKTQQAERQEERMPSFHHNRSRLWKLRQRISPWSLRGGSTKTKTTMDVSTIKEKTKRAKLQKTGTSIAEEVNSQVDTG